MFPCQISLDGMRCHSEIELKFQRRRGITFAWFEVYNQGVHHRTRSVDLKVWIVFGIDLSCQSCIVFVRYLRKAGS